MYGSATNLTIFLFFFWPHRIRVAAAAAASSVARAPSIRRLTGQKGAVSDYFL